MHHQGYNKAMCVVFVMEYIFTRVSSLCLEIILQLVKSRIRVMQTQLSVLIDYYSSENHIFVTSQETTSPTYQWLLFTAYERKLSMAQEIGLFLFYLLDMH